MSMDTNNREMKADFERCALGGDAGAPDAVKALIEKWGPGACVSGAAILTAWEPAKKMDPIPLWLAALVRSRHSCKALIDGGVDLSHADGHAQWQAWRYAAYNGWAAEAADLFAAQAKQGNLRGGWAQVWEAIAEGCQAQEAGWGQKAASWISSLAGGKLGAQEGKLIGLLGKAFDQSAPKEISKTGQSGGWEALESRARDIWGASLASQAQAAMDGPSAARDLALRSCQSDEVWAQGQLAAMLAQWEKGAMGQAEIEEILMQAQGPAAAGKSAWTGEKEKAKAWATSAGRLVAMGAKIPDGSLEAACRDGQWPKAYALALAHAPLREGAAPLWALCKHVRESAIKETLGALSIQAGKAPFDEQSLDIAKALVDAGARASDLGPDGHDALARLQQERQASAGGGDVVAELLKILTSMGAPAKQKTTQQDLEERGLLPLLEFISAQKEREDLMGVAGQPQGSSKGTQRL